MRIIGETEVQGIKLTVFKMNERVSVKFEYNLLEQTYKFRDGSGINNTDDVLKFCSEKVVEGIIAMFSEMSNLRTLGIKGMIQDEAEGFEEII